MGPDAGIDFEVVIEQLPNDFRRYCLAPRQPSVTSKSGKPELGNHVPIDGAQSLHTQRRFRNGL